MPKKPCCGDKRPQGTTKRPQFSPDPLHSKYPHNSDYAFSENRLIDSKELEGLEKLIMTQVDAGKRTAVITIIKDIEILDGKNLPQQYRNINSNKVHNIFKAGNTTLYAKGLPENGKPVKFSSKRQWEKGTGYKIDVVYQVCAEVVNKATYAKDGDNDNNRLSFVIPSSTPFSDENVGARAGLGNGDNGAQLNSGFDNTAKGLSPEGVIAHEIGYHVMQGLTHSLDENGKPTYPGVKTLEANEDRNITPTEKDTKRIIDKNVQDGRLESK